MLRVVFVPGQRPDYVRNSMIVKALRMSGIEVVQCGSNASNYPVRFAQALLNFLSSRSSDDLDVIFIGFYGQPLVPIIRRMSNRPIILDAFISTYDTLCFERKKYIEGSPMCKFFHSLDKKSCQESRVVLLDTDAHVDFFSGTFGLSKSRFRSVLVGADDDVFRPVGIAQDPAKFVVFFHGTYRPLQGIDVIVKAANLLRDSSDVLFRIVGKGPEKKRIIELMTRFDLKNVELIDWIPYDNLPRCIEASNICLGGHFSTIGKAGRVIAGKTFQYLAMKKPTIVGDNPANRELLEHRKSALMVKAGDPNELADAIMELRVDGSLARRIGDTGYRVFRERCTPAVIGRQLRSIVENPFGE